MGRLEHLGLPDAWLSLLNAYLLPREGFVTVEGALSKAMALSDMVFQGTVLGPSLWNAFFGEIADFVAEESQQTTLFADDLSVTTHCPEEVSNEILLAELAEVRSRAHVWGHSHRVVFDPSKESLNIIHPIHGLGKDFKLLGVLMDCRMSLDPCVGHLMDIVYDISSQPRSC